MGTRGRFYVCAARMAVVGRARTRNELGEYGINVNGAVPGALGNCSTGGSRLWHPTAMDGRSRTSMCNGGVQGIVRNNPCLLRSTSSIPELVPLTSM